MLIIIIMIIIIIIAIKTTIFDVTVPGDNKIHERENKKVLKCEEFETKVARK